MNEPKGPLHRQFLKLIDGEEPREALYVLFRVAAGLTAIVLVADFVMIMRMTPGEFGDFFGGVLNPLLTFLTFMGLLITIILQHTELRESREEFARSADALEFQNKAIERQNFEATFFQMLTLHNTIVSSIDLQSKDGMVTTGRDCFRVFYTRLTKLYREKQEKPPRAGAGGDADRTKVVAAYNDFWRDHQLELGHYFRYLYNVIRFVKESGVGSARYLRLIRAQLSDQELLLLFYNCLTPQGEKFRELVEEFSLLDNLPRIRLLEKEHASFIDPSAFERPAEEDLEVTTTTETGDVADA
ncbi:putative phage abortive infection protein [Sphingopyxis sp. MC1]|uniref:putative phage abortive infection protein n=1 Tax=Sphingopyxis sp. MC1 TaxID=1174684 RepID=UPI0002D1E9C2|nr:putative phage abortive infection protein [Sphingopyxis sp. MC1]ENY82804.1 hypothetical protein EBMC1_01830 [Sphingopyxis sp. MC1]MBN2973540.1 putative phage abortive infection protein [Roseomonas aeriglobus]